MKNKTYKPISDQNLEDARTVSLLNFCLSVYPDKFKQEGRGTARDREHSSLIITHNGYYHNSKGMRGDAIDYLQRYEGLTFRQAVKQLLSYAQHIAPSFADGPYTGEFEEINKNGDKRRAFAYLVKSRKLHPKTVHALFDSGLLSIDSNNNLCFRGHNKSRWAEINGTLSDVRYKRLASNSHPEGYFFWYGLEPKGKKRIPDIIAVCESAIDALSLWEISNQQIAVVSMAGLRPRAFDRVNKDYSSAQVLIAVDRDKAGDEFALKYPNHDRLTPKHKDWNEDLMYGK